MKRLFFMKRTAFLMAAIMVLAVFPSMNVKAQNTDPEVYNMLTDETKSSSVKMKYELSGMSQCTEDTRAMFGKKLESKISDDMARSALETEVVKREALMQARETREKLERKHSLVVRCSEQDLDVLQRIVQAEAGGQDAEGKMLVANVIINRVRSGNFPDSITEVVYEPKQFTPVITGYINRVSVSDETRQCVNRALAGEDYSQGATYFMNRRTASSHNSSWFDRSLTFVRAHGGHEFFKEK